MTTGLVFGPVPSRRLGRSLGVNHVPRKHCSYSCVYCQVGRTTTLELERVAFHPPEQVIEAIERRVAACRARGDAIDYVTFVPGAWGRRSGRSRRSPHGTGAGFIPASEPDGEPTLDLHLGEMLRAIEPLGVRRAVLTNGSLLWRDDVRAELAAADLVSIKVDAVDERAWRRVDRPSGVLALEVALDGIRRFAAERRGSLLTETMLVRGLNDAPASVEGVAAFLETLRPDVAYLAVPTRPPAEPEVDAPCEATLVAAFETLAARLPRVELLAGDESGPFGRSGDAVTDLLAILAVHPMQEPAARRYLAEGGSGPGLESLLASGQVVRVAHRGRLFVMLGLTPVRALATARTP